MVAKKLDYAKVFNQMFGTNIKWEKLNLEDLVQLAVLFNDPKLLVSKLGGKFQQQVTRKRLLDIGVEMLEELAEKWEAKGPLITLAKKVLGKEESG